jgi:hypothetical protein
MGAELGWTGVEVLTVEVLVQTTFFPMLESISVNFKWLEWSRAVNFSGASLATRFGMHYSGQSRRGAINRDSESAALSLL